VNSSIPKPDSQTGLRALQAMLRERHPLAALQVFNETLGDVFQVELPGFSPVVMVGPKAARFVLVQARGDLRWRNEQDPVTDLLRHGVLVEDGESHDRLRNLMNPSLHRRMLQGYAEDMRIATDQITASWKSGQVVNMLDAMRSIALLILMKSLYEVDFSTDLRRLWEPILASIAYISPGLWMFWPGVPRTQYRRRLETLDGYLYQVISERRAHLEKTSLPPRDLLGVLLAAGLDDGLVRDQLLTMLIAGHDTSTALLAWTLYLLGSHEETLEAVTTEVTQVFGDRFPDPDRVNELDLLARVLKEALRLYPPIHLGSRVAAEDLEYEDYLIPAGKRVIYSIYLTQRHPDFWPDPHRFNPDRHLPGNRPPPYAWLAFGGGPRNCIGAAFGLFEAKLVLARILQQFGLTLRPGKIHPHMGATLEPRPGVPMTVRRR
jgi:cytochrome P450